MSSGPPWEVTDGVRRAKAFQLAGKNSIRAVPQQPDGTVGSEIDILLEDLRSPHKTAIDMSTSARKDRFFRIWDAIQRGEADKLPAILVQLGSRGCKIEDIGWTY